ncbi:MAG: hypothetical protein ACRER5_10535, partial [Pseudomonas sp.]
MIPHRTQHDELRRGELGVGDVLLEESGVPLVDAPQQVAHLIRKQIAIPIGRGLAFYIAHKPIRSNAMNIMIFVNGTRFERRQPAG